MVNLGDVCAETSIAGADAIGRLRGVKTATVIGWVGGLFAATGHAAVLFQQAPFTAETTGLISTIDNQVAADDFTPTQTVQVTGVKWYGFFFRTDPVQPREFQITFHAGAGGAVSEPAFAQYAVTPASAFAFATAADMPKVNSFSAVIPPVTLQANQRVWISIMDLAGSGSSQFQWQESSLSRLTAPWASRASLEASWQVSNGGNLAFSLEGSAVPEPTSTAFFLFGSATLLSQWWTVRSAKARGFSGVLHTR